MKLPKLLGFTFASESERGLETEIMRSDLGRAAFMGTMFLILSLILAVLWTFHDRLQGTPLAFFTNFSYGPLFAYLVFLGIYEWVYRGIENHLLQTGRRIPLPPRYLSATVEVTLPTVFLLLLAEVVPPEVALNLPPALIYFLFLALGVLRLAPGLALYIGILAGVEYSLLAWSLLGSDGTGSAQTFVLVYVSKGLMMAITGAILAYVTQQIRGRIVGLLEARERQSRTAAIFGQHVSPAVMEKLLNQNQSLVSETRHVTVMFLDIRNFTTFSESRTPEQVVNYLNRLFAFMVDAVNAHQGIVNKFLGDGFLAVFGAPLDDGHSELHAIRAALEISDRLKSELAGDLEPTRIGMGIHSGSAVTGTVGSSQRQEYTLIGDVVNLASRIESQTKLQGAEILVSKDVWDAIGRLPDSEQPAVEPTSLGPIVVKGREQPVELVKLR